MITLRNEPELFRLSARAAWETQPALLVDLTAHARARIERMRTEGGMDPPDADLPGAFSCDLRDGGRFGYHHGLLEHGLPVTKRPDGGVTVRAELPCSLCPPREEDELLSSMINAWPPPNAMEIEESTEPREVEPNPAPPLPRPYELERTRLRSLGILFRIMFLINMKDYPQEEDDHSAGPCQLYHLLTLARSGTHGYALTAELSPCFTSFLCESDIDTDRVTEAMRQAWIFMAPTPDDLRDTVLRDCRADLQKTGRLMLSCPGDRSGAIPDPGAHRERDKGRTMHSHNMDNPMQQLAVLIGLGAVSDQVPRQ